MRSFCFLCYICILYKRGTFWNIFTYISSLQPYMWEILLLLQHNFSTHIFKNENFEYSNKLDLSCCCWICTTLVIINYIMSTHSFIEQIFCGSLFSLAPLDLPLIESWLLALSGLVSPWRFLWYRRIDSPLSHLLQSFEICKVSPRFSCAVALPAHRWAHLIYCRH